MPLNDQGQHTPLPPLQTAVTPTERETNRTSRSGRQLSELEVLQEKHDPEFRRVIPIVAEALKSVVAQHEPLLQRMPRDERYSYYETNAVPQIRIEDYVQRIAEYTYISPSTLLCSLIVLDRLSGRHPTLLFTPLNVFKIFFVAVRIASKVIDVRTLNNKNFAPVGGITNRHLNDIEARMLIDLRFDLYIAPREFLMYAEKATGSDAATVPLPPMLQQQHAQMQQQQQPQPQEVASNGGGGVPMTSASVGQSTSGAPGPMYSTLSQYAPPSYPQPHAVAAPPLAPPSVQPYQPAVAEMDLQQQPNHQHQPSPQYASTAAGAPSSNSHHSAQAVQPQYASPTAPRPSSRSGVAAPARVPSGNGAQYYGAPPAQEQA
jgi:hypothetical protein